MPVLTEFRNGLNVIIIVILICDYTVAIQDSERNVNASCWREKSVFEFNLFVEKLTEENAPLSPETVWEISDYISYLNADLNTPNCPAIGISPPLLANFKKYLVRFVEDTQQPLVVRERALDILFNLFKKGDKEMVDLLYKIIRESGELSITAVYYLRESTSFIPIERVIDLLQHESALTRSSAAIALAKINSEEAVNFLINSLEDDHLEVKLSSIFALSEIDSEKVEASLFRLLNSDNSKVRSCAYIALEQLRPAKRGTRDE
jgi:PBS lyase HEAT-like repeat